MSRHRSLLDVRRSTFERTSPDTGQIRPNLSTRFAATSVPVKPCRAPSGIPEQVPSRHGVRTSRAALPPSNKFPPRWAERKRPNGRRRRRREDGRGREPEARCPTCQGEAQDRGRCSAHTAPGPASGHRRAGAFCPVSILLTALAQTRGVYSRLEITYRGPARRIGGALSRWPLLAAG